MSLFWSKRAKRKHQQKVVSMLNDFHSDLISKKFDYESAKEVKKLMGEVKLCSTKKEALELESKVKEAISFPSDDNGNKACRGAVAKLNEVITGISSFVESPEAILGASRVKDLREKLAEAKQERKDAVRDNDRDAYERISATIQALEIQLSLKEKELSDIRKADFNVSTVKALNESTASTEKASRRATEGVQEAIAGRKEADQASEAISKSQEELLASAPVSDAEENDFDKAREEYLLDKEDKKTNPETAPANGEEDKQ